MYAVVKTGGKQYLVKEGDLLKVEKVQGDVGSEFKLDSVLLTASEDGSDVQVGQPLLADKTVNAKILEQGRGKKISIIKFKSKVRYRRKRGHRQFFTKLQILSIA